MRDLDSMDGRRNWTKSEQDISTSDDAAGIAQHVTDKVVDLDVATVLNNGSISEKLAVIARLFSETRLHDVSLPQDGVNPPAESPDPLEGLQALKIQMMECYRKLQAEFFALLPKEAAAEYKRMFGGRKTIVGPREYEEAAWTWRASYDVALRHGGPWIHYSCSTAFPMPVGVQPACPKCEPEQWGKLQNTAKSDEYRGYAAKLHARKLDSDVELLIGQKWPLIEQVDGTRKEVRDLSFGTGDVNAWPGKCGRCGGPAYEGLNAVDCKNKCGDNR